ncbi:hypothetical protein ABZY06_25090 [Streptomyces sp. NPDC006540]|uniref:hypothetical protein n=1 Tax=Streptomyces sp. NPDC006540 TaxID=3155353 RepID=UPI0033AB59F7
MHITRRRTGTLAGTALLATCLLSTLSACGSETSAPRPPTDLPKVSLQVGTAPLGKALATQATAQSAAAEEAAAKKQCTTDPADRQNCRNPGGTIDPDGGDVDGDGVFEDNEPVGPAYKDPRAYDGGKTSGETQCEWLRSQGIAC